MSVIKSKVPILGTPVLNVRHQVRGETCMFGTKDPGKDVAGIF
jgi:hypothetical protein